MKAATKNARRGKNARTRDDADQPVPYVVTPAGQVFFIAGAAYRRAKLLERLMWVIAHGPGRRRETIEQWLARHHLPEVPARLRILDEQYDRQLELAIAADEPAGKSRKTPHGARRRKGGRQ